MPDTPFIDSDITAGQRPFTEPNGQPFTVRTAAPTSIGLSPRWVQYSGVSASARAVAEALTDLATMGNTSPDRVPTLDREFLAYVAGLPRADKLAPYLQELQDIGFLTVYDGGTDPATGRRRQCRDQHGRPLPEPFEIALEPPASYTGPRNLADVHAHFVGDRDAAYRAAEEAGKRVRTGNMTIRRTPVSTVEFPQVSTDPGFRGQVEQADPGFRGQVEFPQVSTDTGIRGQVEQADPGFRGQVEFPQVSTDTGIRGLQIDRSFFFEEGEEGSSEPVPGRSAPPPVTGQDDTAAREVVRELPWERWFKTHQPGNALSTVQAVMVADAIRAAVRDGRCTLDQARHVALHALVKATSKPWRYVAGAFAPENLPRLLVDVPGEAEPLADNPLPWPTVADASPAAATVPTAPAPALDAPEHCGQCGNPALGENNPAIRDTRHRVMVADNGDTVPCVCHPAHPSHRVQEVVA